jgi:hypothetical protein
LPTLDRRNYAPATGVARGVYVLADAPGANPEVIFEQQTRAAPLGATVCPGGFNFGIFSRGASGVELLLFDREDDAHPTRVIRLDPAANRTYHYWHVFVSGVRPGQLYGYRMNGSWDPANGTRFDPTKVLLDPCAAGLRTSRAGISAIGPRSNWFPAGFPLRSQAETMGSSWRSARLPSILPWRIRHDHQGTYNLGGYEQHANCRRPKSLPGIRAVRPARADCPQTER